MEWYLPITILPGIGMLIMSTTTQMMAVSTEIGSYYRGSCDIFTQKIAKRKISQLGLLTRASALLYIAAGSYVLSGILGALAPVELNSTPNVILYIGTIAVFSALILLTIYATKAVNLRKFQFENNQEKLNSK